MVEETPQLCLDYLLRRPRLNLRKPPALALFCGYDLNEVDFLRLTNHFDDRLMILSLRPPLQAGGQNAWFNVERIRSVSFVNAAQAEYSRGEVMTFLREAARELKFDPSQVYLFGYSQGAVIALSVFLSEPELAAGLILVSGQVTPEIRALVGAAKRYQGKPVLQLHGLQDRVCPVGIGRAASQLLAALPVKLETRLLNQMDHAMNAECLERVSAWLSSRLEEAGVLGLPDRPPYQAQLSGVHLKVRDLERAIQFYIRFLGMELVEKTGRTYAFLTNSQAHHVIALQNQGANAPGSSVEGVGLYAVRFELASQSEFARAYKLLTDAGVNVTLIDHLICWEMHFQDPDGNGIALFWDTRDLPGRSHLWQGRDQPLDPQQVLNVLNTS